MELRCYFTLFLCLVHSGLWGQKIEIEKIDPNMTLENADTKGVAWFDPRDAPFRLVGFPWIIEEKVYRRLPVKPKWPIRAAVDSLANSTAGGQVQFQSDSPKIFVRVKLRQAPRMYHMPATGQSGFDLYVGGPLKQRFIGTTKFGVGARDYEVTLFSGPRDPVSLL